MHKKYATMRPMKRIIVGIAASMFALAAMAQPYPARPLRIVVPTSPGGGTDLVARAIAQRLNERWGQPVVVDNRAGATGAIGVEAVARAAADGYTLLVCTNAMVVINPHLSIPNRVDALRDFAPVTQAASSPFLLVVHPSVPATSVPELIAQAKARPGRLNYSSSGNGSATHLAGLLFANMAAIDLVHIPYKGSSPAIADLIGGQIQLRFSALAPILPHVHAGRLRALAVSGGKRYAALPELPTVAESLPGYVATIWYGVLVPAATPAAIVAKLNTEIVRQLNEADVREKLAADGAEPVANTPAEFAQVMRTESARWAGVIKAAGLRAE
jgi:tripartite-type tricarboxylate transporter receptor subunit TctC